MPRARSITIVFFHLALFVGSLGAQQKPDRPRFILNTNGPAHRLSGLAFSNDSHRLYAAGGDKVVHVWDVGWNRGEAPNEADRIQYLQAMRWEVARGNRGVIEVIATCRAREEIAVGGASARSDPGDIVLFNAQTGLVHTSLPIIRQTEADGAKIRNHGHTGKVMSLDYSPSGDRIISTCELGEVIVWKADAARSVWTPQIIQPATKTRRVFALPAAFLTEHVVVFAVDTAGTLRLQEVNLQSGAKRTLPGVYQNRIAALSRLGNTWAVADGAGRVTVRDVVRNSEKIIQARTPHATDVELGNGGVLAVVSNDTIDSRAGRSYIELFALPDGRKIDEVTISQREKGRAVAISPDGLRLAAHNDDTNEVLVFQLRDVGGAMYPRPLSQPKVVAARGRGRRTMKVAFSADGRLIGFGEQAITHRVNLNTAEVNLAGDTQWAANQLQLGGISLASRPTNPQSVQLSGQRGTIELNERLQGSYASHCFIPSQENPNQPVAVAIGTDSAAGIFVYSIPPPGQAPKLLRYFRDHAGSVVSLAASPDGRLLVSGSRDQTVKLWSLDGIEKVDPTFPNAAAWGAGFRVENGKVIARNVHPAGICASRGIRNGDAIRFVQGFSSGNLEARIQADVTTNGANQLLGVLKEITPLRETLIYIVDQPKPRGFVMRPAWEPLVSVFATERGEWAIWHPQGYFNASAAEGGELFGWQVNLGQSKQPQIFKAAFFQKKFERPDVIREIIRTGNLAAALAAAKLPLDATIASAASELPRVTITSPTNEVVLTSDAVKIQATVNLPATANLADYEIRGAIGGRWLGNYRVAQRQGDELVVEWTASSQDPLNRIEVVATEKKGSLSSYFGSDDRFVRSQPRIEKKSYKLHVLALASEQYSDSLTSSRSGFGKLQFPIDDVEEVIDKLKTKSNDGLSEYKLGTINQISDAEITLDRVKREIETLKRQVNPVENEDVVMVYLSGHGTTVDGEYYYVPTSIKSADESEIRSRAIPWSVLSGFSDVECRVIWMIDTCHSGSAIDGKSSIRGPKRKLGLVVAAATGTASAKELLSLKHGVFTAFVLLGLDGYADGTLDDTKDNRIDVGELVEYVRREVPTLADQRPIATPEELSTVLSFPLVRTRTSGDTGASP